jgi:hypothetical protein
MQRRRQVIHRRVQEIVERFRQKGATSPESALSIEKLGLPPRFEEAMHRRLGQSGVFVEVDGRYYLDETRLKETQEQRAKAGFGSEGKSEAVQPTWLRIAGILLMLPIGIVIALALFFIIGSNSWFFPWGFLIMVAVIMLGLTVARLLYWRSRRRYWSKRDSLGGSSPPL